MSTRALLLAVLAAAAACSSPSAKVGRLYASLQSDVADHRTGSAPDPKLQERHDARAAEVRAMVERGEITGPKDQFEAAVLLVETRDLPSLKLAEDLARRAAAGGEKLAPRVGAEAVDKQLVVQHLPQKYGTQYEWVQSLGQWRLYTLDPSTTDSERRAVGVPSLAELYDGEKKMNAGRTSRGSDSGH